MTNEESTNKEYSKLGQDRENFLDYDGLDSFRMEYRKGRDRINKRLEKGFADINNKLKELLAP